MLDAKAQKVVYAAPSAWIELQNHVKIKEPVSLDTIRCLLIWGAIPSSKSG